MTKRRSSTVEFAAGLGLAGMHSAITLWYRWPMLAASCTPHGNSRHGPEINRMMSEKAAAAIEGVFGVQKEMLRLTARR